MPKIYPPIDEAKTILETASEYTGWNDSTMLDIICDYVNEYHGTSKLLEFIQDLVNTECEETQEFIDEDYEE